VSHSLDTMVPGTGLGVGIDLSPERALLEPTWEFSVVCVGFAKVNIKESPKHLLRICMCI